MSWESRNGRGACYIRKVTAVSADPLGAPRPAQDLAPTPAGSTVETITYPVRTDGKKSRGSRIRSQPVT